jgi:hypothetical protein
MNFLMIIYIVILFVLLTPGVVLRLPSKSTLLTVAIVHGLVFALVFHFTHRHVYRLTISEGFEEKKAADLSSMIASLPDNVKKQVQNAVATM